MSDDDYYGTLEGHSGKGVQASFHEWCVVAHSIGITQRRLNAFTNGLVHLSQAHSSLQSHEGHDETTICFSRRGCRLFCLLCDLL